MTQPLEFLAGGGHVGALMRAHDWSASPLGPPETWPQSLRTVVACCCSRGSRCSSRGARSWASSTTIPYAEILGAKHPSALGRRFYDIWSEIWSDISPLIDAAMAGQASYREDLPLVMNRKGYDEQTWFTFSYSPVRDESGKVAGMFCACSETTQKVLAERALRESEGRLRALVAASSYALYRMSPDWSQMLALDGQGFIADTSSPSRRVARRLHPPGRSGATSRRRFTRRSPRGACSSWSIACGGSTVPSGGRCRGPCRSFDANGNITEWFGAASDVTARKNAEAALRELNETLERRVTEALAERKILADIVEGTNAFVQVVDLGVSMAGHQRRRRQRVRAHLRRSSESRRQHARSAGDAAGPSARREGRVEPGARRRGVHRDRGVRRSGARPARVRDAVQHAARSRRQPHRRLPVRLRRDRARCAIRNGCARPRRRCARRRRWNRSAS